MIVAIVKPFISKILTVDVPAATPVMVTTPFKTVAVAYAALLVVADAAPVNV